MVSVRGFTATPPGTRPTRIVAVTPMCAVTAWAVLLPRDTEATAAAVVAAGPIAAIAAVIRLTARRGRFMMSCSLASPASWPYAFSRRRVIPIQPDSAAGWFVAADCCPRKNCQGVLERAHLVLRRRRDGAVGAVDGGPS